MPYVVARGMRFHVQHLGQGSPVVMVHGLFTGSAASWYLGAAAVLAKRHHVFCYDQRGHGLSDRPASGYDLASLADDLDALTADLEPFALVGHSYGGIVALRLALDRPERVTRLALVDSFIPGEGDPLPASEDPLRAYAAAGSTAAGSAAAGSTAAGSAAPARRAHRTPSRDALLESTTLLDDLHVAGKITDDELACFKVPVLCIAGTSSTYHTSVVDLAGRISGASLIEIPGGHALTVEGGDALARLLVEHCDE